MEVERGKYRKYKKRRPKSSVRKKTLALASAYGSASTIHGISYLSDKDHPISGRLFWLAVVVISILATTYQMASLYNQWKTNPVTTNLATNSLPMEKIKFPAVTVCPQGYTKEIMDNVLGLQFKEYLKEKILRGEIRPKRDTKEEEGHVNHSRAAVSWNMTKLEMEAIVNDFLRNNYPGSRGNPTKVATLLISDNPKKVVQNQAVFLSPIEEAECNETNLNIVHDLNKEFNLMTCPPGFIMVDEKRCVIVSKTEMSYENASLHCNDVMGGVIFELESYDDLKALDKILGNTLFFYTYQHDLTYIKRYYRHDNSNVISLNNKFQRDHNSRNHHQWQQNKYCGNDGCSFTR